MPAIAETAGRPALAAEQVPPTPRPAEACASAVTATATAVAVPADPPHPVAGLTVAVAAPLMATETATAQDGVCGQSAIGLFELTCTVIVEDSSLFCVTNPDRGSVVEVV